jgi:hypothetical protein
MIELAVPSGIVCSYHQLELKAVNVVFDTFSINVFNGILFYSGSEIPFPAV